MKKDRIPTIAFWVLAISLLIAFGAIWIESANRPKPGAARAGCILTVRYVQEAVREFQRQNNLPIGAKVSILDLENAGLLDSAPECTDGNEYSCEGVVPEDGRPYLRCPNPEHKDFAREIR